MQGADFSGVKSVFLVLGCDTDVGKTIVSTGLARAFAASGSPVCYVKPWQTGLPLDSDAGFVVAMAGCQVHTLPILLHARFSARGRPAGRVAGKR